MVDHASAMSSDSSSSSFPSSDSRPVAFVSSPHQSPLPPHLSTSVSYSPSSLASSIPQTPRGSWSTTSSPYIISSSAIPFPRGPADKHASSAESSARLVVESRLSITKTEKDSMEFEGRRSVGVIDPSNKSQTRNSSITLGPVVSTNPSLLSLTRPITPVPITNPVERTPIDYFGSVLPREIKLHVFRSLLDLWKADEYKDRVKANRWVGEAAGRRELVRLSRVSKEWFNLIHDGELWPSLSIRDFFCIPSSPPETKTTSQSVSVGSILLIAARSSSFLRTIDLKGLSKITSAEVCALAMSAAGQPIDTDERDRTVPLEAGLIDGSSVEQLLTRLKKLDLEGCRGFSEHALHNLLAKSPTLTHLNLKAVPCVSNSTLALIGSQIPLLISLNVSRCSQLTTLGILSLFRIPAPDEPPTSAYVPSNIREIRLAGFQTVDRVTIDALARGLPALRILDLSHSEGLTDDLLDRFVRWEAVYNEPLSGQTKVVLARKELGIIGREKRSLATLKLLDLAGCEGVTDRGIEFLTDLAPNLEMLDLSGVGRGLRDEGLIRFTSGLKKLKRIDLEDATELTDSFLDSLGRGESKGKEKTELTWVGLAGCKRFSEAGLRHVVERCDKLNVLLIDNTKATDRVVTEFLGACICRGEVGAEISITDCRAVSKFNIMKQYQRAARPRRGWFGYEALPFQYAPPVRPCAPAEPGRSEMDDRRVVLRSFWGRSLVDRTRRDILRENETLERRIEQNAGLTRRSLTETGGTVLSGVGGGWGRRRSFLAGWSTGQTGRAAGTGTAWSGRRRAGSAPGTPIGEISGQDGSSDDSQRDRSPRTGCTVM